jgi:hypothetical protein
MALRLLPFRDYSEHEVVNLFAYNSTTTAGAANTAIDLSSSADNSTDCDAGVFVKVNAGTLNTSSTDWDPVDVDSTTHGSYLGKTDFPHVGANYYPQNNLTVTATTAATDNCVGITLRQTAQKDENGEKLNYNPQKKDELYAVLPGETVPVLKRGIVTLTDSAIIGDPLPGRKIVLAGAAGNGQASGVLPANPLSVSGVGTILASGYRDDAAAFAGTGAASFNTKHVYGGNAFHKGNYFIVDLNV